MDIRSLTAFKSVMKAVVIALSITLASFAIEKKPGYACSCAGLYNNFISAHQASARATAIFAGKVSNITQTSQGNDKISFAVYHVKKGTDVSPGKAISITTQDYRIGCGYRFLQNRSYFVYAHINQGELQTHDCSRTKPLIYAAVDIFELAMPPIVKESSTEL